MIKQGVWSSMLHHDQTGGVVKHAAPCDQTGDVVKHAALQSNRGCGQACCTMSKLGVWSSMLYCDQTGGVVKHDAL